MQLTTTLHDYRLRYPHTAEYPTLTQSGELAFLLANAQRRAAREQRRRDRRDRFRAALGRLFREAIPAPGTGVPPLPTLRQVPGL